MTWHRIMRVPNSLVDLVTLSATKGAQGAPRIVGEEEGAIEDE